ncbi:MAG: hypothetical protein JWM15_116 [Cryptosporangiaceae bacterium]|jgi:hypothetical protein|nr:hypothetical protein [Cryptosporangiaceae bacterium]
MSGRGRCPSWAAASSSVCATSQTLVSVCCEIRTRRAHASSGSQPPSATSAPSPARSRRGTPSRAGAPRPPRAVPPVRVPRRSGRGSGPRRSGSGPAGSARPVRRCRACGTCAAGGRRRCAARGTSGLRARGSSVPARYRFGDLALRLGEARPAGGGTRRTGEAGPRHAHRARRAVRGGGGTIAERILAATSATRGGPGGPPARLSPWSPPLSGRCGAENAVVITRWGAAGPSAAGSQRTPGLFPGCSQLRRRCFSHHQIRPRDVAVPHTRPTSSP